MRYGWRMRSGRAVAVGLLVMLACNLGCSKKPPKHPQRDYNVIRYRLPLRDNAVSSSEAAHCFVECQAATAPNQYVDCLSACPGFEKTAGETCEKTDVPPEAACLNVRKIPAKAASLEPGLVVLAVIGEIALVVGAASLCSVSSSQCGMQLPPPR